MRQQELPAIPVIDDPYLSDGEDDQLDIDNNGEFEIEMVEQNEFMHDVDNAE